ncbi:MAG: hypothetical protein A2W61_05350, partial [Deltaproteobacteria bacterium RIFCSPLOWO2_01_44_7]
KTGLITSPHLVDVRERIQINRENISWEALTELIKNIRALLPEEEYLSYFEMTTLVGFEYFSKMGIDIAIVETGLGGRLDATNILKPQVAILTPITLDHQIYLGDSVTKIALEKCGIVKPEMTVVSAPQVEEAALVIEESCQKLGVELKWADPETIDFPLNLKGEYQKTNAACALEAAKVLLIEDLVESIAPNALAKTEWEGRLQTICEKPTILLDGAHNIAALESLAQYLVATYPERKINFLVGALKDKNWVEMFAPLAPVAKRFVCVTPPSERGLPAQELANHLKEFGKPVEVFEESPAKALKTLVSQMTPSDLAVATGSLYVVGDILKCFPKPV